MDISQKVLLNLFRQQQVYDDIWDDKTTPAVSSSPAGPPASLGPAGGGDAVFMPWAEGAVGMDCKRQLFRRDLRGPVKLKPHPTLNVSIVDSIVIES